MNKIISRMLVLGLLFSFVQAQDRDIDKDEARNVKTKSAEKEKVKSAENESSSRIQDAGADLGSVRDNRGSAKKGGPGGKAVLSGQSSRETGSAAPARKSSNKAKGGFFSRLFGRSKAASKEQADGQSQFGQKPSQKGEPHQKKSDDEDESGPKPQGPDNGRP